VICFSGRYDEQLPCTVAAAVTHLLLHR